MSINNNVHVFKWYTDTKPLNEPRRYWASSLRVGSSFVEPRVSSGENVLIEYHILNLNSVLN